MEPRWTEEDFEERHRRKMDEISWEYAGNSIKCILSGDCMSFEIPSEDPYNLDDDFLGLVWNALGLERMSLNE